MHGNDKLDATREAIPEIHGILRNAFGVEFEYWIDDDGWRPLEGVAPAASDRLLEDFDRRFGLAALFGQDPGTAEPIVTVLPENQNVVAIPVAFGDDLSSVAIPRVAAIAKVSDNDPDLIRRLAATALLAIEQSCRLTFIRTYLDGYAIQLTHAFEELTWLRNLTERIEYCDVTSEIGSVAELVLPTLRDIVRAEFLTLVRQPGREGGEWGDQGPIEVVCSVGDMSPRDDVLRRLIGRFGAAAMAQPVVCNGVAHEPALGDEAGVRDCVIAPVKNSGARFGWLIAMNKLGPDSFDKSVDAVVINKSLSEHQFGTIEGTLMDSAAILLGAHARNADLFREVEGLLIGVVRALASTIDARDAYTHGHSERVACIARRIAESYGLPRDECEQIHLAGLVHDIGKIGIRDDVLLKPEGLTDAESDVIKQHPVMGYSMLKHLRQLGPVLPAVLHHHECFDGSGYPDGLSGQEIPLAARMISIADFYDAMTSDRPYRKAFPFEKAESMLREKAGKLWDPEVVDAFFAARDDIREICSESDGNVEHPVDSFHTGVLSLGCQSIEPIAGVVPTAQEGASSE
jgi:HD-GYP domain-containing protein (c-di-GMP phosphodiesterase class II)